MKIVSFFNKYLKLCNSVGKTPSKCALEMGISKVAVTNWKNRGNMPTDANLRKIADYFGITVDYLLGNEKTSAENGEGDIITHKIVAMGGMNGDDTRTVSKKQLDKWAELIDATRDLPPEKIDMLIKMAESIK